LPDLKARNKTVLVITHDDRYFHLADRIIKLDYGRVQMQRGDAVDGMPEMADGAGAPSRRRDGTEPSFSRSAA